MSHHLRIASLALVLGMAAAVVVLLALVVAYTPAGAQTTGEETTVVEPVVSDRLPDLRMAHPRGLQIENTSDGRRLLRFASIIVNVGAGPFELRGERAADASTMTTQQRIFDDAGGYREVPTDAIMFYSGDGHNHWHVQDLEYFELDRLDNGSKVGTFAKHGFCFFENYNFGSTEAATYTRRTGSCGRSPSDTKTFMGLGVGWGDKYGPLLVGQYIDVTGLTPGNYRLTGIADEKHWFKESDNTNNVTSIDIILRRNGGVGITAYGPGATPINTAQ